MVITGLSNCREWDGFWLPQGFAQSISFIYGHIYPSEPVYLYPVTGQGLRCTKLEVRDCVGVSVSKESVMMFPSAGRCWRVEGNWLLLKGKGGGVRLSGSSGRWWKYDTYHNWEDSDDELQTHDFYQQLGNFHHKRFKANCVPTSISPVKADSENGLGFCWARGKLITK